MASTGAYKCLCCGNDFEARTADRARGWARYCGKRCKAMKQDASADQGAASAQSITGISVYLMIDGQLCLAPIAAEQATMFVGMLPAFQSGQPKAARLIAMPADVAQHVALAGLALGKHFDRAQAQKGKP